MKYEIIKFSKIGCQPCESVDLFLKSKKVEYKTINPFEPLNEEEQNLVIDLGIKAIPVTILVDDKGNVLTRKAGYNEKALSHLIELYKNGQ